MNVETEKVARRKRKAPRGRVPAIAEQKERRPFVLGWGADLSQREREGVKERIALLAGIVLAVVIVGLIAWGLIDDYVVAPAQQAAANNKQVAVIGNDVIRVGFFKRYESFQNTQYNNQLQQIQQEQAVLQGQKGAQVQAQLAQLSQQQSTLQQALNNLPQTVLNQLIDEQVILQRAKSAGVVATPKQIQNVMTQLQHSLGGPLHYQQFIQQSGLTQKEIQDLQVADYLRNKLQTVLAAKVPAYQLQVRASHILVPSNKHALALSILHQAQSGANFAALAKKYSIDTATKGQGGDLGYFTKDKMVAPFANKAFSLKVGQIGIVKSQFGWHIINVTGRKKLPVKASDLQQQKQNALTTWLTEQRAKLHLERLMSPSDLPNVVTPTPNPLGTSSVPQVVATQPAAPVVTPNANSNLNSHPTKPSTRPAKGNKKP